MLGQSRGKPYLPVHSFPSTQPFTKKHVRSPSMDWTSKSERKARNKSPVVIDLDSVTKESDFHRRRICAGIGESVLARLHRCRILS